MKRKPQPRKCIEWTGPKSPKGYAQAPTYIDGKFRMFNVARALWRGTHGEIPEGMMLLHSCDNRACVNLHHLRVGTAKENMQDAIDRNRLNPCKGEKHHKARLTEQQVREIKHFIKHGIDNATLAAMFDVSKTSIQHIRVGNSWKHVE